VGSRAFPNQERISELYPNTAPKLHGYRLDPQGFCRFFHLASIWIIICCPHNRRDFMTGFSRRAFRGPGRGQAPCVGS
jgi:hypothetical protein